MLVSAYRKGIFQYKQHILLSNNVYIQFFLIWDEKILVDIFRLTTSLSNKLQFTLAKFSFKIYVNRLVNRDSQVRTTLCATVSYYDTGHALQPNKYVILSKLVDRHSDTVTRRAEKPNKWQAFIRNLAKYTTQNANMRQQENERFRILVGFITNLQLLLFIIIDSLPIKIIILMMY